MEGEKHKKEIIYILSDVIVAPGFMLLYSTSPQRDEMLLF